MSVERGARLEIVAEASLNPDIDRLSGLELLVHGDVVATEPASGRDRIELRTELVADGSMWIAVRALGERQEPGDMTVAHSAPIFVVVDREPTWKAEAVPEVVARSSCEARGAAHRAHRPVRRPGVVGDEAAYKVGSTFAFSRNRFVGS